MNINSNYALEIQNYIHSFFSKYSTKNASFQNNLVKTIIACFHIPGFEETKKKEKSLLILECLFAEFSHKTKSLANTTPFSFNFFLNHYSLSSTSVNRLIQSVFQSIYYNEVNGGTFSKLKNTQEIELLLIQLLAVCIPKNELNSILNILSIDQQVRLVGFLIKHYREGSFIILNALKKKSLKKCPILLDIISGLNSQIYDVKIFLKLLHKEKQINLKVLENIRYNLKKNYYKNIKTCFNQFEALIKSIIDFPITVLKCFNDQGISQNEEIATQQSLSLQNMFQHYLNRDTLSRFQDFHKLIEIIGLFNHFPYVTFGGKEYLVSGFKDRIKFLYDIFKHPYSILQITAEEIKNYISFILTVIKHLESATNRFKTFNKDFQSLVCAISTTGKDFPLKSSLESLLEGIYTLRESTNFSVETPIFIYDQSNEKLFKHNQNYINLLNKRFKAHVIHLSSKQCLALAKKLCIEGLINTSNKEEMGFGGARNCAFLLSPLLKHLFHNGYKNIKEIEKLDNHKLKSLFNQIVLFNELQIANTVFMLDDDMQISAANIFSYALFASECRNKYVYSHGYCVGRATKYLNKFRNLDEILNHPLDTFDYAQWLDIPFSVKMAEYVGKPKICLNLPLGQEEAHLQIEAVNNPMLQISRHLGGTRYPKVNQIPSHPIIGMDIHLKKNIPYVLGISLSMDLIDPSNTSGKCVLPWNDFPRLEFTCLHDVLQYMSKEQTKTELKKRFWNNVSCLFEPIKGREIILRQYIDELMHMDIKGILINYRKNHLLDFAEKRSLKSLGKVYKSFQKDAFLFCEFGGELLKLDLVKIDQSLIDKAKEFIEKKHQLDFVDYSLTYQFYLMCLSLGAEGFGKNVGLML